MTKAVRVHKVGGPEALVYEDVDVPAPEPGEVRIRQRAVGLNFIDVYYRTGLYKAPGLPFIAGNEAAGEVLAVGAGVTNFHPGDRVAYYTNFGAYTGERNIPWEKLVKLPDHITHEQGAVLMLKGLTVWYLLHKTFKVEPHHRVLIHAAAGGIGLLACQWASALGAHVIGTVGSKAKADLALANGCDHVILYNEEDFVARVKQISRNELCDVVYDGVGKSTFPGSLSCLKPRGLFVSFGSASGPVPPFSIAELNNHGSLFATRPKLNDYIGKRSELLEGADTLFAAVINGKLHVPINHAYALKDAARAHVDLESRATTGASISNPESAINRTVSLQLIVSTSRHKSCHRLASAPKSLGTASKHSALLSVRCQACALPRLMCAIGRTHDVSSSVPARKVTTSGRSLRSARIWPPHSAQNQYLLAKPLAPTWCQAFGSPRVSDTLSRLTGIDRPNALPDHRWHSVQWQAKIRSGIALTAKRTAAQGQPPVRGRAGGCNLPIVKLLAFQATRLATPILVRTASRQPTMELISWRATLSAGMKRNASGLGALSSTPSSNALATIDAAIGAFRSSASSNPRPRTSPRPCRAESRCSSLSR